MKAAGICAHVSQRTVEIRPSLKITKRGAEVEGDFVLSATTSDLPHDARAESRSPYPVDLAIAMSSAMQ